MLIIAFIATAIVAGYIGHRINAGTITAIEAELTKAEAAGITDAKTVIAAIKSHL